MHSSISNYQIDDIGASGELTNLYGQQKDFPDQDYSVRDGRRRSPTSGRDGE